MKHIYFKLWSLVGLIASILIFFQLFIMTKQALFLFLLVAITTGLYFTYKFFLKGIEHNNLFAKWILYVIIFFHILPLLLQLASIGQPRFDTVILAIIGLGLLVYTA